jgi:hypothetical protein
MKSIFMLEYRYVSQYCDVAIAVGGFRGLGSIYHGVTYNGLLCCSLMSPVMGFIFISRRTRAWRTPERVSRLQHSQEAHSYQGGTIVVRAGIRLGGRTQLVWIQGSMTAQKYHEEVVEPVIVHNVTQNPNGPRNSTHAR